MTGSSGSGQLSTRVEALLGQGLHAGDHNVLGNKLIGRRVRKLFAQAQSLPVAWRARVGMCHSSRWPIRALSTPKTWWTHAKPRECRSAMATATRTFADPRLSVDAAGFRDER